MRDKFKAAVDGVLQQFVGQHKRQPDTEEIAEAIARCRKGWTDEVSDDECGRLFFECVQSAVRAEQVDDLVFRVTVRDMRDILCCTEGQAYWWMNRNKKHLVAALNDAVQDYADEVGLDEEECARDEKENEAVEKLDI